MEAQITTGTAPDGLKWRYEVGRKAPHDGCDLKNFEDFLTGLLFHDNWSIKRAIIMAQEEARRANLIRLALDKLIKEQNTA